MEARIEAAVELAQSAFWAKLAEQFPEITSGDFPPGAQIDFDTACLSAAKTWVGGNASKPVLSEDDLLALGITVAADGDQPGLYYWSHNSVEYSEMSLPSKADAIEDATEYALGTFELSRCDNCNKVHSEETLVEAKNLSMRTDPGGTVPSGECPDCGALAYPIK